MAFNPNSSQDTKGSIVSPISKYKLVFLGDQSVGKTSIINRFMFDTFDGKEHPTIGIDFISKTLYYDDRTIRLQLWDTAGQERFRSLIPSYIRDSAVAIVVFDISNMSSFENVGKWIEDVRSERGSEVIMCLVANKIDLSDKRVVTTEMASQKAKDLEVLYMEVSAKIGTNVSELFKTISMNLTGNEPSHLVMPGVGSQQTADVQNNNGNIQLGDRQNILPEKKKCC